jgi:hypothetical protein
VRSSEEKRGGEGRKRVEGRRAERSREAERREERVDHTVSPPLAVRAQCPHRAPSDSPAAEPRKSTLYHPCGGEKAKAWEPAAAERAIMTLR